MNEYIYFDQRYVRSILSQEMSGLTTGMKVENEVSETSSKGTTSTPAKVSGNVQAAAPLNPLGIPIPASGSLSAEKGTASKTRSTELGERKVTHEEIEMNDAAYESLEEVIQSFPNFEALDGTFKIFNLDTFLGILKHDAFERTKNSQYDRMPRDQRRTPEARSAKEKLDQDFKFGVDVLSLASAMLPSSLFLVTQDGMNIFPLISVNLYIPPNAVSIFYQNTETRVLYKDSGLLVDALKSNFPTGLFSQLYEAITSMGEFFYKEVGVKENAKLCLPIAWYQRHDAKI